MRQTPRHTRQFLVQALHSQKNNEGKNDQRRKRNRQRGGVEVHPLRPFVAALEARPAANFRWTTAHSAIVDANLTPGDVVHVQIASHGGWHAMVNGARRAIEQDNLGLMTIDPGVTGPCRINLVYDGGREMRIAHWLCALSVISLVVLSGRV